MRISDWSSDVCSSDLLGAREIRMGADAAVADGKRMAVRQHHKLMRPDPVGRQFPDAGVAGRAIVDADDATTSLVVVFGRVEQDPVRSEYAVTGEQPRRRPSRRATRPAAGV